MSAKHVITCSKCDAASMLVMTPLPDDQAEQVMRQIVADAGWEHRDDWVCRGCVQ